MGLPEIQELIPHRPPMILLDRLVRVEDLTCISEYQIPKQGVFIEESTSDSKRYLSEMGLIEHIAQSSMAFIQYYFSTQESKNNSPNFGYISSIQHIEITGRAFENDILETKIQTELVFHSENLKICHIESEIFIQKVNILNARMKMVLQTKS